MSAVHDYPLIAITEVFDMPSVDHNIGSWRSPDLGPTHEILERKLNDVLGGACDCGCEGGYNWTVDTEFHSPIHIVTYTGPGCETYGHALDDSWIGCKLMGNGHHRLAFQALVQGALFVPYTDNPGISGY